MSMQKACCFNFKLTVTKVKMFEKNKKKKKNTHLNDEIVENGRIINWITRACSFRSFLYKANAFL